MHRSRTTEGDMGESVVSRVGGRGPTTTTPAHLVTLVYVWRETKGVWIDDASQLSIRMGTTRANGDRFVVKDTTMKTKGLQRVSNLINRKGIIKTAKDDSRPSYITKKEVEGGCKLGQRKTGKWGERSMLCLVEVA